jgi:succinate dehydrogenase / fumarate reductase iron-sulfur subunit
MTVQLGEQTYRLLIARSASGGIATGTQQFDVALEDRMTVLDALFRIQRDQDTGLTFRCACRVGMCGTCAICVNGIPRLACKTRVRTLHPGTIRLAPLPNLPVIKDLVVSLEPFFEQWKRVKPAFRPHDPESQELACVPEKSAYAKQTPAKRDCITCGICYAACGVKSTSGEYLGPAAINKAFLRLMDPRDMAVKERLDTLNAERGGVWRCHTQFNCTAVCPKGITLTDSITRLKRAMLFPKFQKNKFQKL